MNALKEALLMFLAAVVGIAVGIAGVSMFVAIFYWVVAFAFNLEYSWKIVVGVSTLIVTYNLLKGETK